MSDDVQFEEDTFTGNSSSVLYGRFAPSRNVPKMVQWIIRLGLAKTPAQANYVLLGVAIVAALLSLYFFFWFGQSPASTGFVGPQGVPGGAGEFED
jgi:hypothetical protein